MREQEIMRMRYGEMQDMLSCMAIENGGAEQIIRNVMPYEKVMELR